MTERQNVDETIKSMVSTEWFFQPKFKQGSQVTDADHVRVLYPIPSARSAGAASEYLQSTRGVTVSKGAITAAVRRGELPALRIGNAMHFKPEDLDAWLSSRTVNQ